MYRFLFKVGNFKLPLYGIMAIIGYFLAVWIATLESKRKGIKPVLIQSLSIWIIVGMITGGRLWYVLEHWDFYAQNILAIFQVWEGGMVFYGGFIGGFIGGMIFVKMRKLYLPDLLDILAPGVALAIGAGRIGCFLNGCCFGKITDSIIGMSFPKRYFPPVYWNHLTRGLINSGAEHSLPVIPTQIISSLDLFAIFGILWFMRKKSPFRGFLFVLFLGLYGIHRFIIDFFRYYEGTALILDFITLSQLLSIVLIILSVIVILIGYWRNKDTA